MEFREWLVNYKNYSTKAAQDVCSRLKRVERILDIEAIDGNTLPDLEENFYFLDLSMCVKSQLRRAVRLLVEFSTYVGTSNVSY